MRSTVVRVQGEGTIVLPRELREKYGVGDGEALTLIDLGGGSILLTRRSRVSELADEAARLAAEDGVSLDDMLTALDEERTEYYRSRYGTGS